MKYKKFILAGLNFLSNYSVNQKNTWNHKKIYVIYKFYVFMKMFTEALTKSEGNKKKVHSY